MTLTISKPKKVLLVGDGAVGSSFAFALQQMGVADELVIADLKEDHAKGDVLDLEDISAFTKRTKVRYGQYSDAKDADVVVITAGVPRKPGETRLDLVNKNVSILKSIVEPVVQSGFAGTFVVSSNPVDILTTMTQKLSGFPKNRVIGTGTSLDTARLLVELSQKFEVSIDEINAYVLGEHGDSEFVAYDEATINGIALKQVANDQKISSTDLSAIEEDVRKKGSSIIGLKGATFYGVATCLANITKAILTNQSIVLPISAPYRDGDLYIGNPAVINGNGIANVIDMPLSDTEQTQMQKSVETMQTILNDIK